MLQHRNVHPSRSRKESQTGCCSTGNELSLFCDREDEYNSVTHHHMRRVDPSRDDLGGAAQIFATRITGAGVLRTNRVGRAPVLGTMVPVPYSIRQHSRDAELSRSINQQSIVGAGRAIRVLLTRPRYGLLDRCCGHLFPG